MESSSSEHHEGAGGWGTMGGSEGDGFINNPSYNHPPAPNHYNVPNPSMYANPQGHLNSIPTSPPVGSGSITRFATPEPQQMQQQNMSLPPGSYQSQQGIVNQNQNVSGFASRSQQSFSSQLQQSTQLGVPNSSQMSSVYSSHVPPNSSSFTGGPNQANVYVGNPQPHPSVAYQTQPPVSGPTSSFPSTAGMYGSRNGPGQGAPHQQIQPGGGTFAARSAQALYGAPPQQVVPAQQSSSNIPQGYNQYNQQQQNFQPATNQTPVYNNTNSKVFRPQETQQAIAFQQLLLTETTRKVQEHSYYMRQAMEQNNLPVVLDRAAFLVGELGGPIHGQQQNQQPGNATNNGSGPPNTGGSSKLAPKNYYELYMRVLEELPVFEEYLMKISSSTDGTNNSLVPNDVIRIVETSQAPVATKTYTMRELYDCVQYCPRVVPRLYLQITAGSALIRSGEVGAKFVMEDLRNAVKCEQNPIRGLFIRHYLLTSLKDKLPTTLVHAPTENGDSEATSTEQVLDDKETDPGNVKDSYEFILSNFMEMNKLWVRIQHLPGEGKDKDVRKRRERERNDLRILVGTNLVRLSQLESVTSKIYGEIILKRILDHIVIAGDPLSQAYLMDCLVQVFPDEYHIETLSVLLNVCPRLRDKVNIRTILQGLMDRLANYLAEEELLDESDTNEVKKTLARDAFGMFEDCVRAVYNSRGPKLTSKEVIRLQTALLQFSIKCYPGNTEQVCSCISTCVAALGQSSASYEFNDGTVAEIPQEKVIGNSLDDVAIMELEKFLSIPLGTLALKVLHVGNYTDLIGFLPWLNRCEIAAKLLHAAVNSTECIPETPSEVDQLFRVIEPLLKDEYIVNSPNPNPPFLQDARSQFSNMQIGAATQQGYYPNAHIVRGQVQKHNSLICKLIHLFSKNKDRKIVFQMLEIARKHVSGAGGGRQRMGRVLVSVIFASLQLCRGILDEQKNFSAKQRISIDSSQNASISPAEQSDEAIDESLKSEVQEPSRAHKDTESTTKKVCDESSTIGSSCTTEGKDEDKEQSELQNLENIPANEDVATSTSTGSLCDSVLVSSSVTTDDSEFVRKIFLFIQSTIAEISYCIPETTFKVYLDSSLTANAFATHTASDSSSHVDYSTIAFEFLSQAFTHYEERIVDAKIQYRCLVSLTGTLLELSSLSTPQYESMITKAAQYSAKVTKKQDQCHLVALCAHLFYPVGGEDSKIAIRYSNPQRALECLQRCLKLADSCTTMNPVYVKLFVDTFEHYVYFFEKKNPSVSHTYVTGLIALIKEHLGTLAVNDGLIEVKNHFTDILSYISKKKVDLNTCDHFGPINLG